MARFWLHGHHLFIGGKKMSKSRGNILTTGDLLDRGYNAAEIRFFLIDGHYREKLDYTERAMKTAAEKLREIRNRIRALEERAGRAAPLDDDRARRIGEIFRSHMDRDLEVKDAFDGIFRELEAVSPADLDPGTAAAVVAALRKIDGVLNVIFECEVMR
jgi:cysteinyl-tRNA synthetase